MSVLLLLCAEMECAQTSGQRHGKGLATWPDGMSYNGDWNYDTRNGTGNLTPNTTN